MIILSSVVLGIMLFVIPFLTGNLYSLILRQKRVGIVGLYFSGMAVVYAGLFIIQMAVIKFKFNFLVLTKVYHIYFLSLIVLGLLAFAWKLFKEKTIQWDIVWSKHSWWIYGLILLQGILYIGLKNPYFENNALLETTNITLATETIYKYNAYSCLPAVAGFPLANKLMFLPMMYAYLCTLFGVGPAIVFNFIMPTITFVGFYLMMMLWVQRLAKEHQMKWQNLLLMLLVIVQLGDSWVHSTSFRVLHEGYSGEAIFFGILFAYAMYEIKNRGYLIGIVCVCAFPGLVKYSAVTDFLKGFTGYWKDAAAYGGMLLLFVMAVVIYCIRNKRIGSYLLIPNLIIALMGSEIWFGILKIEKNKWRKMANGILLCCFLMLCGNMHIISKTTEWRTNSYGIPKNEYDLLEIIAKENEGKTTRIMAYDDMSRWICRLDFNFVPVVGYDLGGKMPDWYSYEVYDDTLYSLWECVNFPPVDMENKIMNLKEEISMDYIIVKRITDIIPIQNNDELKCVLETPSYLVYSVDKWW